MLIITFASQGQKVGNRVVNIGAFYDPSTYGRYPEIKDHSSTLTSERWERIFLASVFETSGSKPLVGCESNVWGHERYIENKRKEYGG